MGVASRSFAAGLLVALLWGSGLSARAQSEGAVPSEAGLEFQFDNFWMQALPLVQAQLDLAARLEESIANSDAASLTAARGDLRDRLNETERFLLNQYRDSARLCLDLANPPATGLTPPQQRVYCALYQTWRRLRSLATALNQPLAPTPSSLLSIAPERPRISPDDLLFGPAPAIAPRVPLPAIPEPLPRVISQPAKLTVDVPPRRPQILDAAAASPLTLLAAVRQDLRALQPLLPEGETLRDRQGAADASLALADYADMLARPNTGVARLYPANSTAEFAPLPSDQPGYAPSLALVVEGDVVAIAPNPLRYGFLAEVGERRLDGRSLRPDRSRYSFFWDYQPPPHLDQIQAHQRAFFFDKLGVGSEFPAAPPFPGRLAMELERTYLLRLVQYQLPAVVLRNEPIPSERRRYTSAILEMFSSDLLLAVQPIARHPDGSYTAIWQLIEQFPAPPVTDLDRYVRFE